MHIAQRETELNWTRLNCSVQFSFPLCIEPTTTCDDSRRLGDEIGGRRRFFTVKNLRRPSSVVAAHRRFSAQRETELNSTELNWTIQFSSVFRCTLGFTVFIGFINRIADKLQQFTVKSQPVYFFGHGVQLHSVCDEKRRIAQEHRLNLSEFKGNCKWI